jgi:hypothetical protein
MKPPAMPEEPTASSRRHLSRSLDLCQLYRPLEACRTSLLSVYGKVYPWHSFTAGYLDISAKTQKCFVCMSLPHELRINNLVVAIISTEQGKLKLVRHVPCESMSCECYTPI